MHRSLTLGEVLDGDRMAEAMYSIAFKRVFGCSWFLVVIHFSHYLAHVIYIVLRRRPSIPYHTIPYPAENVENKVLCKTELESHDIHKLTEAIEDLFYFEFIIGRMDYCFAIQCYRCYNTLYYTILYYTILCYTILCYTILYYTMLPCSLPYAR